MTLTKALRNDRTLRFLLLLALVVRLAAAVSLHPPLSSDDRDYVLLAESILTNGNYALDGVPTAYRPPGYSGFLAGVFFLFGRSLAAVRVIQALLDALTCLFVYVLAARLTDRRTALLAAGTYAVFPLQILYAASVMSETLFTLLMMWSLVLMTGPSVRMPAFFSTGCILGAAVLVRPAALIVPALVMFLPSVIQRPVEVRARVFGFVLAGLVLVISPWIVRNGLTFGRPAIASNAGVNFWIGNHPGANGSYSYPDDNPLQGIQDEFARSDAGFRLGIDYWFSRPGAALVTTGKKFAHFFGIDYWVLMSHHFKDRWSTYERAVMVYREIPVLSVVVTHAPIIVSCLLTLVALASIGRDEAGWKPLIILLAVWVSAHLVFFGSARVRFPLHPLLIIFAVRGWSALSSGFPRPSRRRLAVLLGLAVLLLTGWIAEVWMLLTSAAYPTA